MAGGGCRKICGCTLMTITEASFIGSSGTNHDELSVCNHPKLVTIYLTADKKVSGGVTGTWSVTVPNKTLTVNGIKCKVSDAWDWEKKHSQSNHILFGTYRCKRSSLGQKK